MGAAAQSRTLSWLPSTYTATESHSSNLLIGLLLSIGIPVIGYFTLVRLDLAECKGQATSLSGSCKPVVHQLSSAYTRMSKFSETLLLWIHFTMSAVYLQIMLRSHMKIKEVAMEEHVHGLAHAEVGGGISGGPQLLLGSVATCCPTYTSFGKKYTDRYILFCKWWFKRRNDTTSSSLVWLDTCKYLRQNVLYLHLWQICPMKTKLTTRVKALR